MSSTVASVFIVLGILLVIWIVASVVFLVLRLVGGWMLFSKSGEAGWKSLIPFYSDVTLYKLIGVDPLLVIVNVVFVILSIIGSNNTSTSGAMVQWISFVMAVVFNGYIASKVYYCYGKVNERGMGKTALIVWAILTNGAFPYMLYGLSSSYYYLGSSVQQDMDFDDVSSEEIIDVEEVEEVQEKVDSGDSDQ